MGYLLIKGYLLLNCRLLEPQVDPRPQTLESLRQGSLNSMLLMILPAACVQVLPALASSERFWGLGSERLGVWGCGSKVWGLGVLGFEGLEVWVCGSKGLGVWGFGL